MYVAAPWFELSVLMEIWCQRWCFCHVKICVGRFHFSPLCLFLLLARAHGLSFLCICLCLRQWRCNCDPFLFCIHGGFPYFVLSRARVSRWQDTSGTRLSCLSYSLVLSTMRADEWQLSGCAG